MRRAFAPIFLHLAVFALPALAGAGEAVLGLVAAPNGHEAVDPRFVVAELDFEVAAGDALVFRVDDSTLHALDAGVELGFADGTRASFLSAPVAGGWRERRAALTEHAGRRITSVAVVARGLAAGPALLRVDDVAIERVDGVHATLFDGEFTREQRDPAARAAVLLVDGGLPAADRARAPSGSVRDPWAALDLSTLRKRTARSEGSSGARDHADAPNGLVFAGDGVPLAFANDGEPDAIAARAQRIALEPLQGGSHYELYLAVATTTGSALDTTWRVVGADGEARDFHVAIPARASDGTWAVEAEQGFADAGCVVLDVPVASTFPIAALQLPDDPRVELLAATALWRKGAIEDARFRRAFLARERPSEALTRYLRALRLDGIFVDVESEDAHERELFRRLLAADPEAFDHDLVERLAALKPLGAAWRDARITFVPDAPLIDPGLANMEWERATIERETDRVDALRRYPNQRTEAPDGRTLELLAEKAPELARGLAELAQQGRVVAGPIGWTHSEVGLVGEAGLARQLAYGRAALERRLGRLERWAWAPSDLAWFRQLPQLAAAAGADVLLAAPVEWTASPRPLVCALEGPDRARATLVTPPRLSSDGRFAELLPLGALAPALESARTRNGARELAVRLVVAGADEALEREHRRRARDLALADLGPKARTATWSEFLADARRAPGFEAPVWKAMKEGTSAIELAARSDALHAWARRAENRLVDAELAEALAAPDGHQRLRALSRSLWERVLANHAAAARLVDDAARIDDAREVAGAADALVETAVRVLALAADTEGLGDAVFVFNPLAFARTAPVTVADGEFDVWNPLGRVVPSQRTAEGKRVFEAELPPFGYAVYRRVPRAIAKGPDAVELPAVRVDGWTLTNRATRCDVDPRTGGMTSLRRRADGKLGLETLRGGAQLELVDAAGNVERAVLQRCDLLESGPVRARVRTTWVLAGALVDQELVLRANAPAIEAVTRVEGELHGALRVVFEVVKPRDAAPRHVPFGYGAARAKDGERSRSGLLSWVSQGDGFGVALASEDAAACGTSGGRVWLWLADPEPGVATRTVRWSCLPFEGSEQDAHLMAFGQETSHAARAFAVESHPGVRPSRHAFLDVARLTNDGHLLRGAASNAVVSELALTPDNAGWILRLYDASGLGGEIEVDFDRPIFGARRVDLANEPLGELKFEPKRFRLRLDAWRVESVRLSWKP
ncbi:MAG: hypothetical protein HZA53_16525 [Planctomycetes bacterium]|nr:hypothetical protein [Planctomycetota bacterium]